MNIMLVYQAGIANVFEVDRLEPKLAARGKTKRIMQGDYRACENFARGCGHAGAVVRSVACNLAGDIRNLDWLTELNDAPWNEKFSLVSAN